MFGMADLILVSATGPFYVSAARFDFRYESGNSASKREATMVHSVEREIFGVGYRETSAFKDTYGGEVGHVFIECLRIKPANIEADTVLVFSHPIGGGAFLPAITQLARAGHHVMFVNTLPRQRQRVDHGEVSARSRRRHQRCEEPSATRKWCSAAGPAAARCRCTRQAERTTVDGTPAGDAVDLAGIS
jgi:hypothetical protein